MTASAVARDRTKTEHVALVRGVKWCAPDGTACILELTDGFTAHGNCDASEFTQGTQYRFFGRWKNHPKWGDQFHFSSHAIHSFGGRTGVVTYLCKVCEGIGERTAARLWDKFGPDAVRVLREEPQRVVEEKLLTDETALRASQNLEAEKHLEATRIDLFELFKGRGFHGKIQQQCITKWGAKAPTVIRRDPFKLLGLAGAGFKRCDGLWNALGLPLHRLKRQMYAASQLILAERNGHTWVSGDQASDFVIEAIGSTLADPFRALKLGIRSSRLRARKDEAGDVWIALASRAEAERRIADAIKRLCLYGRCEWPDAIPVSTVEGDGLPSTHQAEQLRAATLAPVGCFVGGPGTGKTHTLSFLLKALIAEHGEEAVAVCAPTGKAAVRATQSLKLRGLDIRATTIHQLLEIGRNGHDGNGWGFMRNADCPLDQQFIIVDESSMIDTNLMADLFDACGTGCHILFVGDPYQLPPVGHGAPLRDMLAAGVPFGELAEVRRNAGRIVHACVDIKAGRPVTWSEAVDLDNGENLRLVECGSTETANLVCELLETGVKGFHPVWQTQVIVGLNEKGNCSRTELNARLQKLLNPDGRGHPKCKFRAGDKIICLKNTFLRPVVPTMHGPMRPEQQTDAGYYRDINDKEAQVYCANGELGRVVAVGEGTCVCRFGEADSLVRVGAKQGKSQDDGGECGASESDFDFGYAVTCHKCQGSESPCVLVVADDSASSVATREWWYTGISRASKLCVVVGPKAVVAKQVAKLSLVKRKTFLKETIQANYSPKESKS